MDLKEWVIQHVKHQDMLKKELEGYEEKDGRIEFEFEDKTHDYVVAKKLGEALEETTKADLLAIACPNTEDNLKTLIENWEAVKDREELKIIFVNLESNKKWIIRPQVHHKVADPESLEDGLRAMHEQAAE